MVYHPELNVWGNPEWFHHHGRKMRLTDIDLVGKSLFIEGSAASIKINQGPSSDKWMVRWTVILSQTERVSGSIIFKTNVLLSAFGLSNDSIYGGDWLLKRYGGACAEQHYYIRWYDCLNIPCPGTGHDGDPNISILLNEEIKEAIKKLLA